MIQKKLKQHEIAQKFIRSLVQGHIHSFLLIGKGGLGKTEVTLKTLDSLNLKENKHFKYLNNHCTPKRFYQILKEVNKLEGAKLLLLDDFDIVLKNKAMVGMLRSALWGDLKGRRKISWYSTTADDDEEFYFKGKIIFLLNELNMKDPLIRALVSRGYYYNITLTNPEIISLMRERIKEPYGKLEFKQRKKVLDYIVRAGADSKKLSLRTLPLGYELFLSTPWHYQRLLSEALN